MMGGTRFAKGKMVENDSAERDMAVAVRIGAVLAAYDLDAVLNDAENMQARRFLKSEDSERYRTAHGLKRLLLGAAIGWDPVNLQFSRTPSGKPILENADQFDFNLSHGGDWIALALSWSGRIGIDVEVDRPESFWQEISTLLLAPGEAVNDGFLKLWTAKEAALKAHGVSFAIAPNTVTVTARESDEFFVTLPSERLSGIWSRLDAAHVLGVATDTKAPEIVICHTAGDLQNVLCRLAPAM